MKYSFIGLTFWLAFFAGCSSECSQTKDKTKRFIFLSRDGLGGTGIRSVYSDNLLVDKNSAQNLSIYNYITMARQYVDTVHADIPVYAVTFYGVDLCDPEIHPASANMREYALIDISFAYDDNESKTITGKSKLYSITLWKEGQDYSKNFNETMIMTFDKGQMTMNKQDAKTGRILLDSLAYSDIPLKDIWKNRLILFGSSIVSFKDDAIK